MEEFLSWLKDFFVEWGFGQGLVIVIATLLTLVLKIPVKKAAESYEAKTGIDKSRITWAISLFPMIFSFAGALIIALVNSAWDISAVSWPEIAKQASAMGMASIGVFEAFKKWAEALTAKKTATKVEAAKAEAVQDSRNVKIH